MGIQNSTIRTIRTATNKPVVATQGEYNGKPTLSIGIEDGNPKYNLSAGAAKWGRIFTLDPEGDSNLTNVFTFAISDADAETAERAHESVEAFIAWYQATYSTPIETQDEEEEGAPIEPEVAEVAEAAPVEVTIGDDVETQALKAKYRKMLSTQLPRTMWLNATEEQKLFLVTDAFNACHNAGMPWDEYRRSLVEYTVEEYMVAVS